MSNASPSAASPSCRVDAVRWFLTRHRIRRLSPYNDRMSEEREAESSDFAAAPLPPFDLGTTFVHLGLGGTATSVPDFSFDAASVRKYLVRFARDRDDGRLVGMLPMDTSWGHWERHVNGDELVVVLSGRCDVIQDLDDGTLLTHTLSGGEAIVNPRGIWHTSDVHEPGSTLFVAAGRRTDYRPRTPEA